MPHVQEVLCKVLNRVSITMPPSKSLPNAWDQMPLTRHYSYMKHTWVVQSSISSKPSPPLINSTLCSNRHATLSKSYTMCQHGAWLLTALSPPSRATWSPNSSKSLAPSTTWLRPTTLIPQLSQTPLPGSTSTSLQETALAKSQESYSTTNEKSVLLQH